MSAKRLHIRYASSVEEELSTLACSNIAKSIITDYSKLRRLVYNNTRLSHSWRMLDGMGQEGK